MEKFYTAVQGMLIGTATAIAAYFDSTFSFVCALILAFLFNILAGFKADEGKFIYNKADIAEIGSNAQGQSEILIPLEWDFELIYTENVTEY